METEEIRLKPQIPRRSQRSAEALQRIKGFMM
jgi:hypothetical protein